MAILQRGYSIEPLTGGGWRLAEYVMADGKPMRGERLVEFPADHRTDPTGEVAYEHALREAEAWRRQSPAPDRRANEALRHGITRLRLAEFTAAEYLPDDHMHELTAAIDGVVALLRQQLEA